MKQSAGLLVYRKKNGQVEVLIVHPGGPYFAKKDEGVWGIPKGIIDEGEDPLVTAKREFVEEIGLKSPDGNLIELGEAKYPKSSKNIKAWAVEGDVNLANFKSNTMELEWPPRSGKKQEFPEIDRAQWFSLEAASIKMFKPQVVFLERLAELLKVDFKPVPDEEKQINLL